MTLAAGIGFKPQHFQEALSAPAAGFWFEVHAENYFAPGGPRRAMIHVLRRDRPVSVHGVGLSLASAAPPDPSHLEKLRRLVAEIEPALVSEHLAWSRWGALSMPDLLPFPRTREALDWVSANIDRVQETLKRPILIENPSLYMDMPGHEMPETEFLSALTARTGCGLLVDVNNVHVSANNIGFDPRAYLDALPAAAIGEIHLAGHTADAELGAALLIDTHGTAVAEPVWALYAHLLARIGSRPTLIERDENIPAFDELAAEASRAAQMMTPQRVPAHV